MVRYANEPSLYCWRSVILQAVIYQFWRLKKVQFTSVLYRVFYRLIFGWIFCLRIVRYGLDLTFLTLNIKLNIVVDVSEGFLLGGIVVEQISHINLACPSVTDCRIRISAPILSSHVPTVIYDIERLLVILKSPVTIGR